MSERPLLDYCKTENQYHTMSAWYDCGCSANKASKQLGKGRRTVDGIVKTVKEYASSRGYNPEYGLTHALPPTEFVKGRSILLDQEGNTKAEWIKTCARTSDIKENVVQMVQDMEIKPFKPVKARKTSVHNLLTVYPMGDPHIGMYAWADECGEDFDCDIAERDLCAAIDKLVSSAQPTEEAVICNLGDFFHADNNEGTTKRSGNVLDVDSRKPRVTQIGVQIMVYLVNAALRKHQQVTVINEIGNHDDESSFTLSLILDAWFRNEPRVSVDLSPRTFHYYRFGQVLLGVTHGHNCKPDLLNQVMATDRKEDWGQTEHRYWLTGHIHHISRKEYHGVVVETFRTLAGKDAWHAAQGYRSGRDMVRITYHEDFGEVGRETLCIQQIRGLGDDAA
jgi:hypothetical protein